MEGSPLQRFATQLIEGAQNGNGDAANTLASAAPTHVEITKGLPLSTLLHSSRK